MKIFKVETTNGTYQVMGENMYNVINLTISCIRESIVNIKEIKYPVPKLDKAWQIGYAQWCITHDNLL